MFHVYVGTYTETVHFSSGKIVHGKGKGIYHLTYDAEARLLQPVSVTPGVANPSFLALSPDGRHLYAASETKQCRGGRFGGEIGAYAVEENGDLRFLNSQVTDGWDSCHVAVDPGGTHVSLTNYGSCTAALFPILPDGGVGEYCAFLEHSGSSVHPTRQKKAFPHSTVFSPDGKRAYILDLGMDEIVAYRFDGERGTYTRDEGACFRMRPGSGPRHAEWHPNKRWLYVVDELACAVTVLDYCAQDGTFTEIGTHTTLLQQQSGDFTSADIHLTPDGRFVYASTRGDNTIACFRIDQQSGAIEPVDQWPSGGQVPRGFAIDPTGGSLLAANQNTDNIVIFAIDRQTGRLEKTGEIELPNPVCIRMCGGAGR